MTTNVFLNLLKCAFWGTKPEVPSGFNQWMDVIKLAKVQSVLPLVADVMLKTPEIAYELSDDTKARLKSIAIGSIGSHVTLNRTLVTLVEELRKHDIEGVLLKGQGIARNYPVTELRQCGDIDFYVGTENYLKACEVLGNIASWKDNLNPMETTKHYDVRIGIVTIEIHRYSDVNASAHYDRIYQRYSDEGLSKNLRVMEFAGVSVNTPADDFNAFYIFNHLMHHFLTSGIGIRQFCDWMMFLHRYKDSLDYGKLERIIKDMGMMGPWQSMGCVLVKYLGMPQEVFPFYNPSKERKVKRILKHVMTEGNFGQERAFFKDRSGEGYFYGKMKSFFSHLSRSAQLLMIFPSHIIRQFWNTVVSGFKAVWRDRFSRKK